MRKQFLLGLMAMLLPLALWALEQTGESTETGFVVTLTSDDLKDNTAEYSGKAVSVTVNVDYFYMVGKTRTKGEVTKDTDYEISYSYKKNESAEAETIENPETGIKNAGIYTVTVKGLNNYDTEESRSVTFTITQVALDLTGLKAKEGAKIQYGASDDELKNLDISQFVTLTTTNGLVSDDADEIKDALKCLTLTKGPGTEDFIGGASLLHIVKADKNESTNYEYTGKGEYFEVGIGARDLTLSFKEGKDHGVYNGEEVNLKSLKDDIEGLVAVYDENIDIELSVKNEETVKDAGSYTLEVQLTGEDADNYNLISNEISYTIDPATLNISLKDGKELSKTYDGNAPTDEEIAGLFTISTTPANISDEDLDKIALKIETPKADAGKYNIDLYVGEEKIEDVEDQTELPNYTITLGEENEGLKYTISQRKILYYFTGKEEYSGDTPKTVANIKPTIVDGYGFVNGEEWEKEPTAKVADGTTVKNVGSYPLVVDEEGEEDLVTENYEAVQVTSENINELGIETIENLNQFEVISATMTITVSAQSIAYGAITDEILEDWKSSSNTKITPLGDAFKYDRAAMRVLVKLALSDEVEKANRTTGDYTGGIVVDLKSEEDVTEADWKDLKKYGFNTYETVEQLYTNFGGVEGIKKNAVNGNLTIGSYSVPVELSGWEDEDTEETVAEKLEGYEGAVLETVKITDLTNYMGYYDEEGKFQWAEPSSNFEPTKWYTLALPFDVEISELSKELGYAIVYVPNNEKTVMGANGWATITFSFTFEKIPANTMMLIRVDGSKKLSEGLTFSNKKIVNLTEEEKDGIEFGPEGAGIKYVPVYAKKDLEDMNYTEWYLLPPTGTFHDVTSLIAGNMVEKVSVYPFNAYIKQPGTAAGARFIIEDADGTTTEINAVTGEAIKTVADGWYTVGGMKLNAQPTQKGVYINNGKKVVIK